MRHIAPIARVGGVDLAVQGAGEMRLRADGQAEPGPLLAAVHSPEERANIEIRAGGLLHFQPAGVGVQELQEYLARHRGRLAGRKQRHWRRLPGFPAVGRARQGIAQAAVIGRGGSHHPAILCVRKAGRPDFGAAQGGRGDLAPIRAAVSSPQELLRQLRPTGARRHQLKGQQVAAGGDRWDGRRHRQRAGAGNGARQQKKDCKGRSKCSLEWFHDWVRFYARLLDAASGR